MKERKKYYRVQEAYLNKKEVVVSESLYYSDPGEYWHDTKEDALSHFYKTKPLAEEKAIQIKAEYEKLQERLGFYISYDMSGDTHGIFDSHMFIGFKINGIDFFLKLEE